IWDIIDERWNDKLKTPLHKAGYYLNPLFYYENKAELEEEVFVAAVVQCVGRVYHDNDKLQDMIVAQLNMYTNGTDSFGSAMAIRQRKNSVIFAANWWAAHGTDAKELRKMAIKILNLTCS
uniref:Uncharacterized protein n=1 Tax=Triticum urartu TaxID=4572 RepID=A0A8R7QWP8_TRIUA